MKTARMIVDRDYTLAHTDDNLFCSFVEPLGRCIYGGLFEPGHPSADENGFRRDVLALIRPLNLTMNRFPGGNYTSTCRCGWNRGALRAPGSRRSASPCPTRIRRQPTPRSSRKT